MERRRSRQQRRLWSRSALLLALFVTCFAMGVTSSSMGVTGAAAASGAAGWVAPTPPDVVTGVTVVTVHRGATLALALAAAHGGHE